MVKKFTLLLTTLFLSLALAMTAAPAQADNSSTRKDPKGDALSQALESTRDVHSDIRKLAISYTGWDRKSGNKGTLSFTTTVKAVKKPAKKNYKPNTYSTYVKTPKATYRFTTHFNTKSNKWVTTSFKNGKKVNMPVKTTMRAHSYTHRVKLSALKARSFKASAKTGGLASGFWWVDTTSPLPWMI